MHNSSPKDILTLSALTGLSTAMLICSRIISQHLDFRPAAPNQLTALSLEQLTGIVLGLLGALILAWLALGLLLALVAAASARLGHQKFGAGLSAFAPAFLARLAVAAVGSSLVLATSANAATFDTQLGGQPITGTIGTATAMASGHQATDHALGGSAQIDVEATEISVLSPGWVPQPVSLPLQRIMGGDARPAQEVVVRHGDTLWSIAARHLGQGASTGQIAEAWPRWYAANREPIGPDPDHLLVGLVLQAPSSAGTDAPDPSRHQSPTRSTP